MAMKWTDEQQRVIDAHGKDILVSAAAGSGKTAVLVERIIQMITDEKQPIDIDRLLVLTFTNAAATEMKERIGAALDKKMIENPDSLLLEKQSMLLRNAQITTIDSFCLYVIRNYFNEIDLDPSFRIADSMELTLMRKDAMEQMLEAKYEEASEDFLDFVECYAKGKTDESIEDLIEQIYDYSRSYPWPKIWIQECMRLIDIKDETQFFNHPLIQFIQEDIKETMKSAEQQIVNALRICKQMEGPYLYEEALQDDLAYIRKLLEADSFEKCMRIADTHTWTPLSRKKMIGVADQKREMVKGIRGKVKDAIDKLAESYFCVDTQSMIIDIQKTVPAMKCLLSLVQEFSDKYQALKEKKNVVDFGDLEHFALQILIKRNDDGTYDLTDVAKSFGQRFDEVMCDEYQDSNFVQEMILKAVSGEKAGKHNFFMVGDVKQSIYKFRLAKPELFMEKYKTYPTDQSSDTSIRIDLHKNFRSRKCVVDFVNLIFEHIMTEALGGISYDADAALNPGAVFPQYSGEGYISNDTEILLVDVSDQEQSSFMTAKEWEAKAVADKIHEMISSGMQVLDKVTGNYRAVQYKDIVVLFRTMIGYTESFAAVFEEEGIPVHTEVSSGFFDTMEIRTMIALLNIIDNPLQDIAMTAVMKSRLFEFTDEALAMIRTVDKNTSFYEACSGFMSSENDAVLATHFDFSECLKIREKLKVFLDMLQDFRQAVFYMPIHKLILMVYEKTGFYHIVSAMPLGVKRRANLDMLVAKAIDYEKTSYKGLFNFVRYIQRLQKYNTDIGEASVLGEHENAVRMMSIHKSKGLEYPIVFVSGMSKRFNQQDARTSLLIHSEYGLGPEAIDEKLRMRAPTILKRALAQRIVNENLGEELRVLYVALTRAKEKLIISGVYENIDKAASKWAMTAETAGDVLDYVDMVLASGYMDWIMPVVLKSQYRDASNAKVSITKVSVSDLIMSKAAQEIDKKLIYEKLKMTDEALLPEETRQALDKRMYWVYPHQEAVLMKGKMTVSELKLIGQREAEDEETDDSFVDQILRDSLEKDEDDLNADKVTEAIQESETDKAADIQVRMAEAARKGTAVHKLMEHMPMATIRTLSDVEAYMKQMGEQGIIEGDVLERINPWKLYNFCRSELGRRMAKADYEGKLYREQQFMIGIPAKEVLHVESEETILVQGVIDACFEEDGKIVIIDYKTDYVKDEHVLVERYQTQLDYYERAASLLMSKEVSEKYIYSFKLDKAIALSKAVER